MDIIKGLKRGAIGLGTSLADINQNKVLKTIQKRDPYLFSEEYLGKPSQNFPGNSYDSRVQKATQLDAKTRTKMAEDISKARAKRVQTLQNLVK